MVLLFWIITMNIEQDKLDLWAEINRLRTEIETLTDLLKTLEEKINVLVRDVHWRK